MIRPNVHSRLTRFAVIQGRAAIATVAAGSAGCVLLAIDPVLRLMFKHVWAYVWLFSLIYAALPGLVGLPVFYALTKNVLTASWLSAIIFAVWGSILGLLFLFLPYGNNLAELQRLINVGAIVRNLIGPFAGAGAFGGLAFFLLMQNSVRSIELKVPAP